MVLRRTLPSRLTGAAPAVASVAEEKRAAVTAGTENLVAPINPMGQTVPTEAATQAMALAAATAAVLSPAAPVAVMVPEQTEPPIKKAAEEHSVDAGFAVLGNQGIGSGNPSPRVLEDSFAPAAQAVGEQAPELVPQPAPSQDVAPAPAAQPIAGLAEVLVATLAPPELAAEVPAGGPVAVAAEPATTPAAAVAQGPTDFLTENPFVQTPAKVASRPNENPLRRRVAKPEGAPEPSKKPFPPHGIPGQRPLAKAEPTLAQAGMVGTRPTSGLASALTPKPPQSVVEEIRQQPTPVGVAPSQSVATKTNKPRVTTPRDFAAATVQGAAAGGTLLAPTPALNMAPEIPIDTRPLNKVDEELIASGIIAGPAGDSLTNALPGSMAVAENAMPADFLNGPYANPDTNPYASPDTLTDFAASPLPAPSFTLATGPASVGAQASAPASGLLPSPTLGGWDITPTATTPPPDIFKPMAPTGANPMPAGFESNLGLNSAQSRMPPPALPESRPSRAQLMAHGRPGKSWVGSGVAALALGAVGLFVWNQATAPGGLENAKAQLAKLTQPRETTLMAGPATDPALLPPPSGNFGQLATNNGAIGNAQINFAPAAPDPNQPIAANGTEAMPEDISLFAKLQREVQAARAAREGGAVPSTIGTEVAAGALPAASSPPPLTKAQSDQELAEYRRILAEGRTEGAPKPREFLRDPAAYMDGQAGAQTGAQIAALPEGALLPPPATRGESGNRPSSAALPPPNELYTNNPRGLPIVAEPQMQEAPRVRQLSEFAAEIFPAGESKVKIPQGVRPKMAATDFPSLEVLSFVPGRGVIAATDGKEGVLLVGETISGWELTNVTTEMAEFQAGGRSYYLTAQN